MTGRRSIGIVEATTERGAHCPLLLYADSASELPVQAEQGPHGYEVTNRYSDGIVGISEEDRTEAEIDESPACVCCMTPISYWQR